MRSDRGRTITFTAIICGTIAVSQLLQPSSICATIVAHQYELMLHQYKRMLHSVRVNAASVQANAAFSTSECCIGTIVPQLRYSTVRAVDQSQRRASTVIMKSTHSDNRERAQRNQRATIAVHQYEYAAAGSAHMQECTVNYALNGRIKVSSSARGEKLQVCINTGYFRGCLCTPVQLILHASTRTMHTVQNIQKLSSSAAAAMMNCRASESRLNESGNNNSQLNFVQRNQRVANR